MLNLFLCYEYVKSYYLSGSGSGSGSGTGTGRGTGTKLLFRLKPVIPAASLGGNPTPVSAVDTRLRGYDGRGPCMTAGDRLVQGIIDFDLDFDSISG